MEGLLAGLRAGAEDRGEQEALARALERLPTYVLACRLRMAGIYSFRPLWHDLALELLGAVADKVGLNVDDAGERSRPSWLTLG